MHETLRQILLMSSVSNGIVCVKGCDTVSYIMKRIFHTQMPHGSAKCGATCLQMVYSYFKKPLDLETIWRSIKAGSNQNREYCSTAKMAMHGFSNGLFTIAVSSHEPVRFINTCLENDIIPIPLYRPDLTSPYAHFSVIVGIDNNTVYLNDPEQNQRRGWRVPVKTDDLVLKMDKVENTEIITPNTFVLVSQTDVDLIPCIGRNLATGKAEQFDLPRCLADHSLWVLNPQLDRWIEPIPINPNSASFLVSDQRASAGTGILLGPDSFHEVLVNRDALPRKAAFGIPVAGDSMTPEFNDSDILIISEETPELGEFGVFKIGEYGYVKKRGIDCLISLNKEYSPIPMTEGCEAVGKIIGILPKSSIIQTIDE